MTDKSFIIENAREYAKKGKIDKAIAEWSKILAFGRDGHVCNNIGDLYIKKEAQDEAIEFFAKAAQIFKRNGFDTKAIAIYNKILTIEPDRLDIVNALTKLHLERGFPGKALEDILKIAETLSKEGNAKDALKVLESALSISPSDMQIQEKIDALSHSVSLEKETEKGWIKKLHWAKSWIELIKTSGKAKTRRKTIWSSIIRWALFVLAAIAALTMPFGDGERISDDVMIEVSLMSSSNSGKKQPGSLFEEEYLDDEIIAELNELLKDESAPEIIGEPVEVDQAAPESAVIQQDGVLNETVPETDLPATGSESAVEENTITQSAATMQDGILTIPVREDDTAEAGTEAPDTETKNAEPEMNMQDNNESGQLQEDNAPVIKSETADKDLMDPEPAAASTEKEPESNGQVNERPAEDRSAPGLTFNAEEETKKPDARITEKQGPASVPQKKRLVTYEEQFNGNTYNREMFDTPAASASITNGKFYLENKSETGIYIALSSYDLPGNTDFVTEASISTEGNPYRRSYGMVLGFKDAGNFYVFKITGNEVYKIGKIYQGAFQALTGGKLGDIVIHENTENTLKVEKEGSSIRFYINDFFLNELSNVSFPGSKTGFIVEGKIKIAVHKTLSHVWFEK